MCFGIVIRAPCSRRCVSGLGWVGGGQHLLQSLPNAVEVSAAAWAGFENGGGGMSRGEVSDPTTSAESARASFFVTVFVRQPRQTSILSLYYFWGHKSFVWITSPLWDVFLSSVLTHPSVRLFLSIQVKAKVAEMELPVTFHDAIDHAELGKYKVRVARRRS